MAKRTFTPQEILNLALTAAKNVEHDKQQDWHDRCELKREWLRKKRLKWYRRIFKKFVEPTDEDVLKEMHRVPGGLFERSGAQSHKWYWEGIITHFEDLIRLAEYNAQKSDSHLILDEKEWDTLINWAEK